MFAIFETIAVALWLTKDNLFYLFNFSYIGGSIALGLTLGFVSWELCMVFAGRFKEISPTMHFITLISIAYMFTL